MATAIISLIIVWPWHGRAGHRVPRLWEHLQRFVWTDDAMEEALAVRNASSQAPNIERVRHPAAHCVATHL